MLNGADDDEVTDLIQTHSEQRIGPWRPRIRGSCSATAGPRRAFSRHSGSAGCSRAVEISQGRIDRRVRNGGGSAWSPGRNRGA
jgi:hypothetical protein